MIRSTSLNFLELSYQLNVKHIYILPYCLFVLIIIIYSIEISSLENNVMTCMSRFQSDSQTSQQILCVVRGDNC